jgi:MoxR-like ATPase
MPSPHPALSSVEATTAALTEQGYFADRGLVTTIFLAASLRRPLLLEGEAGVGKTEVAKVLAAITGGELIRLQCYEGIDASQALYEWNYTHQLLHLRTAEAAGTASADTATALEEELFTERFLVRRPILRAIDHRSDVPPVLLIDEVDRADDEFEAFLLEALSDYTVTVPELGTLRAELPPIVIITSNRTRDVHDALKRRALHHWVDHPDFEREVAILRAKAPAVPEQLAVQIARATGAIRELGLYKPPGVAETLDWANAMHVLGETKLTEASVDATLGTLLKYREDQERVRREGLTNVLAAALSA